MNIDFEKTAEQAFGFARKPFRYDIACENDRSENDRNDRYLPLYLPHKTDACP